MEYAICIVPAAPLRKEPSHRTEMVSQLLFGETMQVLEIKDEWMRIKTIYDDYEGWLTNHLVSEVDESTALQPLRHVSISILNEVQGFNGPMNVTIGSHLNSYDPVEHTLWNSNYKYYGSVKDINGEFKSSLIIRFALEWSNAPYLWGGKTIFGVDCSGFVQTVYKLVGIKLKRDAYQQAEQGKPVKNLHDAREADLAFFQNKERKIVHVGILMTKGMIIHAAGKVRIDKIDGEGIINTESGERIHWLHSIRRVTPFTIPNNAERVLAAKP